MVFPSSLWCSSWWSWGAPCVAAGVCQLGVWPRERDSGLTQPLAPTKWRRGSEGADPDTWWGGASEGASQALGHWWRKSIRRGPDLAPPPSVPRPCAWDRPCPGHCGLQLKRTLCGARKLSSGKEGSWPKMPRLYFAHLTNMLNAFLQDWWSILHFYKLHNTKMLKTYTYFNKNGTNFNINAPMSQGSE